jgi:hypothetical protein
MQCWVQSSSVSMRRMQNSGVVQLEYSVRGALDKTALLDTVRWQLEDEGKAT